MKKLLLISCIFLLLSNCFVRDKTLPKQTTTYVLPELCGHMDKNCDEKGHTVTTQGKKLTFTESMTEGLPGVLNAIKLLSIVVPLFDDDNDTNKKNVRKNQWFHTLHNEEMLDLNLENKLRYEDEQKQIKLNQAKHANLNFKESIKNTTTKRNIIGYAKKGTIVNAYFNNILIGSTVSDENGKWIMEIEYGKNNYDLKYKCWEEGPESNLQC